VRVYPVALAVALHEKGSPPLLAMVNFVDWTRTQMANWMVVGWTSRVPGTGAAVGDAPGAGAATGVCTAPGSPPVVGVGSAPGMMFAVVVAAAPGKPWDDALEFEEELLLEDAEGAMMTWKPICCTSAASRTATNNANRRNLPAPRAL
jgi:hypothetical protein